MAEHRAEKFLLNEEAFKRFISDNARIVTDKESAKSMSRSVCRLRKDLTKYIKGLHVENIDPAVRASLFRAIVENDGFIDFMISDASCSIFIAADQNDPRFVYKGHPVRADNSIVYNNCITAIPGIPGRYLMCFRCMTTSLPMYGDGKEGNEHLIGVCHGWDQWFDTKQNNWAQLLSRRLGQGDISINIADFTGLCTFEFTEDFDVRVHDVQFDVFPEAANTSRVDARLYLKSQTSGYIVYNSWSPWSKATGSVHEDGYGRCVNKDGAALGPTTHATRMSIADLNFRDGKWRATELDRNMCAVGALPVEKNWQFVPLPDGRDAIAYGFDRGSFIAYDLDACRRKDCSNLVAIRTPAPFVQQLVDYYGGKVHVSLSTQPVDMGDEWLMVGHTKVEYKDLMNTKGFAQKYGMMASFYDDAVSNLSFSRKMPLILHIKYMYFMFFFTLDKRTLTLKRMSASFIPTTADRNKRESHLPWLLVFPTGLALTPDNQAAIVSYGEGDMKMKLAMFHLSVIGGHMLKDVRQLTPETYEFRFFVASDQSKHLPAGKA